MKALYFILIFLIGLILLNGCTGQTTRDKVRCWNDELVFDEKDCSAKMPHCGYLIAGGNIDNFKCFYKVFENCEKASAILPVGSAVEYYMEIQGKGVDVNTCNVLVKAQNVTIPGLEKVEGKTMLCSWDNTKDFFNDKLLSDKSVCQGELKDFIENEET